MKTIQFFSFLLLAPMLAALLALSPHTAAAQELCGTQSPDVPVYPPPQNYNGPMVDCYPDIPGPYFIRIYVHVIHASNCTGGQEDAIVRAAIEQMRKDFAPLNIFFVWDDCLINCINDNDLYILGGLWPYQDPPPPPGIVGLTTLEVDYGHDDGIDIFIFPENNGYGPPGMATTPGGTLAIGGLINLTSGESFNPLEYHILSHEMGHCLGLHHTFRETACSPCEYADGSNGCFCGDEVKDTPPHPGDNVNDLFNNTSYPQCNYAGSALKVLKV